MTSCKNKSIEISHFSSDFHKIFQKVWETHTQPYFEIWAKNDFLWCHNEGTYDIILIFYRNYLNNRSYFGRFSQSETKSLKIPILTFWAKTDPFMTWWDQNLKSDDVVRFNGVKIGQKIPKNIGEPKEFFFAISHLNFYKNSSTHAGMALSKL